MRLGSSIQKHAGPGAKTPTIFFSFLAELIKCFTFFFLKWPYLYERYGIYWNEWKINFLIFMIFSFWDMVTFVPKISQFSINLSTKSTITWKIENRRVRKSIFHSIQHCAHLLLKCEHFWPFGGVCMGKVLRGKSPQGPS